MINWLSLILNIFWIVGAAILLAAFSFHHFLARQNERSLRSELEKASFSRWFWLGLLFICIGLAGTSNQWWETAVWAIFILISLFNLTQITRQAHD